VLDGGGDAVAQTGAKAAISQQAQQLARAAHELGRSATPIGQGLARSNLPRSRSHGRS
jgi:hypothetical protein